MDVIIALLLTVFLAPLLLAIFVLLFLDGGSAIYRHTRVGRAGRKFECLKFRTMYTDADLRLRKLLETDPVARAEWSDMRKLTDDPRVTRFGHFLRISSLDELPQIFNVLRGDMSLVGPRPIVHEELDQTYRSLDADWAYMSVRPGITGLWQVSGRSTVSYRARIELDLEYCASLSLLLDLKIIMRTIRVVVLAEGAR